MVEKPSLSKPTVTPKTISPETRPTKHAAVVSSEAQPAVMPTRPPRMPLANEPRSYFFAFKLKRRKELKPPQAAERVVVTAQWPATSALEPDRAVVEPALNPYQPNQRMKVPMQTCESISNESNLDWNLI